MSIDPLIFFDLIAAVFLLSLAITAIAISYARAVKKFNSYQKEADLLLTQIHKKESDLLEDARIKAGKIIEEANVKAQDILNSTNNLNNDSKKTLEDALEKLVKHQAGYFEKVSEDFLKTYQQELASLKEKNIEILRNVSKNIEEDTTNEVKDFDSVLEKETIASQKIVEEKIEQEYTKIQKDTEEYRSQMIKKVDEQIYKIIEEVSKQVLGKGLSLQEHEDLVIDALSKAKKEGIAKYEK
ncbi:MAG: hypothetical protein M1372_02560 [Patescibacteria group bacterium]|nr:hypothetical protein [Patescibacteria group bacterium]